MIVRNCLACVMVLALMPLAAYGQSKEEIDKAIETLRAAAMKGVEAENSPSAGVINVLTDDELTDLLKGMGYVNIEGVERNEDRTILRVIMDGRKVLIGNFRKSKDMQLYVAFVSDQEVTQAKLQMVNDWNRTKRFTKAYIDDEGAWVLEADMDMENGVTKDTVEGFIKLFLQLVPKFVEAIEE